MLKTRFSQYNLLGFWAHPSIPNASVLLIELLCQDPCIGENKKLRVRYLFRDQLHQVTIDDVSALRIPMKSTLLPFPLDFLSTFSQVIHCNRLIHYHLSIEITTVSQCVKTLSIQHLSLIPCMHYNVRSAGKVWIYPPSTRKKRGDNVLTALIDFRLPERPDMTDRTDR